MDFFINYFSNYYFRGREMGETDLTCEVPENIFFQLI